MAKVEHITEGPISSTILRLAWPVVASMFLEFGLTVTNYFWVGFLGTKQQDAVMTSMIVTWTLFATSAIIVTGLTALVSRAIGAKEESEASYVSKQGLILAVCFGLVFTSLGVWLTPSILRFMKAGPDVVSLGIPYLRIYFIGMTIIFLNDAFGSIFRATGDTKSTMIAFSSGTLMNFCLDPLLIFGVGPFPKLGVAGAAVATTISVLATFVIFVTLILKKRLSFSLSGWQRTKPDLKTIAKIFRLGIPISLQNIVFVGVYWFIIQIVHHYGDAAGAAMGIGNRMESLSFLTTYGFAAAASTMVGQNMGARQPDRAAKCAWGSVGIVVVETFIISIVFIALPKYIARVFTSDPQVLEIAIDYLIILGLSQIFMGIEITLEGAFTGAGHTIPPMAVSIPGSIARLPLAYYLCFVLNTGINGVWWTLTITSFAKAIILAIWFRKGTWRRKKLEVVKGLT